MQTTGAVLFAVKRCILAWVRSAAQDGRRVRGLLYRLYRPTDASKNTVNAHIDIAGLTVAGQTRTIGGEERAFFSAAVVGPAK